ncbi:hypothetical protein Lfu02_70750 [Longispora fulva]|nr:hypothetical protein Lfu02_70750 [Longispora fulva]
MEAATQAGRARRPPAGPDAKAPHSAGQRSGANCGAFDQRIAYSVSVHVSMRPTSWLAVSCTRRVHVPLRTSPDRFTV